MKIVKPEVGNVREVWPNEASDFTPWLAENLDVLGDLGLGPLELVEVEARLPGLGRSLDILAETPDGRRVAIENQYGRADHDHLTRGLAYAVGHQAAALVIVAERHSGEFVAVADYLNEAREALGAEDGIAVFMVDLSVDLIGDYAIPRLSTVSSPNAWKEAVHGQGAPRLASIEDFLADTDGAARAANEKIVKGWQALPGATIRLVKAAVSLRLEREQSSVTVANIWTNGDVSIYRQYVLDAPWFSGSPEDLDALLHDRLPSASWGDKAHSVYATRPAPDVVCDVLDTVATTMLLR